MKFSILSFRATALLLAVLMLAACSQQHYYIKGLRKAQDPSPSAVYNGLNAVTTDNKSLIWQTIDGKQYVLAATWKSDTTYYTKQNNFDNATGCYKYNTGSYPIWVTMAPQLKDKHFGDLSDKELKTRMQQLLGLPPTANYSYILEIWVSPDDIFRPCFDPSTGKSECEFAPSKEDLARTDHMCWIYQYIYNSYSDPDPMKRYPYTHLGYTYDWSRKNRSHVGLSEYVIGANKNIYIKKVYTTKGYFN